MINAVIKIRNAMREAYINEDLSMTVPKWSRISDSAAKMLYQIVMMEAGIDITERKEDRNGR